MNTIHPYWANLAKKIEGRTSTNFFEWNEIRDTMYAISPNNLVEKFSALKEDWEFWAEALCISDFGGPTYSELYGATDNNLIQQAYHLYILKKFTSINFNTLSSVIEIGGGFGALAGLIHRLGFHSKYFLYDLPALLNLQKIYLENTLVKPNKIKYISDYIKLPSQCELLIALFSLAEIPESFREKLLFADSQYILLAYGKTFENINNEKYFEYLPHFKPNYKWTRHSIGESFYLVGEK